MKIQWNFSNSFTQIPDILYLTYRKVSLYFQKLLLKNLYLKNFYQFRYIFFNFSYFYPSDTPSFFWNKDLRRLLDASSWVLSYWWLIFLIQWYNADLLQMVSKSLNHSSCKSVYLGWKCNQNSRKSTLRWHLPKM